MIEIANKNLGNIKIKIEDNSELILEALKNAVERGLSSVGETAEGYAKEELSKKQKHASGPDRPYVDTGRLRNSITYATKMEEGKDFSYTDNVGNVFFDAIGKGAEANAVYIGTNVEYALWVELGTGIYASDGQGRKEVPWAYQDDEGNWHMTSGIVPVHFLKKAATEHIEEYRKIIKESLENA